MLRSLFRHRSSRREQGQALVLFSVGLVGFLGLVSLSVDVGRFMWARTTIQGAVDAAALAAAQSMPDVNDAGVKATDYWNKNSGFIQSQGKNVHFDVAQTVGNRALTVHADAQIPTWFARFVGLDHWSVSADASAASTVMDLAVVMDISQSMCDDTYPRVDQRPNMSPGAGTVPLLKNTIDATQTVIAVTNAAPFKARIDSYFTGGVTGYGPLATWAPGGTTNDGSAPYYVSAPRTSYGGLTFTARPGLIAIGNVTPGSAANGELMQVTAVNTVSNPNTITVIRGAKDKRGSQTDPTYAGIATTPTAHPANSEIWFDRNGSGCSGAAKTAAGPYEPYDTLVDRAKYFTTLFNSNYDKFGVAYFSSSGTLKQALTSNFTTVTNAIGTIAAPSGGTNTAHGISVGRQILTTPGSGKRANANKVMVLITDGRAKEYCGSSYSAANYYPGCTSGGGGIEGNSTATYAAEQQAIAAVGEGVQLYVIGLGAGVDSAWLKKIADGGKATGPCQAGNLLLCRYYDSPTKEDLSAAFVAIAQQTHIALTK